jgi:hypothetical protein
VDSAQRAELTEQYLADPFLRRLYDLVMAAGPLRSVTIDLTEVCNLRCDGCYFFVENMDDSKAPKDEGVFERFIESEKARAPITPRCSVASRA